MIWQSYSADHRSVHTACESFTQHVRIKKNQKKKPASVKQKIDFFFLPPPDVLDVTGSDA